ncbi:MAG: hypothetical protein HJJLKODD_02205 [Phycisphaerae bacterium]|nr:hypothetical protein [Phycisphaerae bacterium]
MNEERSRDYRVGMFISLAMVILAVLILLYGEEPKWFWSTKWKLEVSVKKPQGIEEGTPVFLEGVKVGRVAEIRLRNPKQPDEGAIVVVEVEEQHRIPIESTASLHPKFGFDKGAIQIVAPSRATDALPIGPPAPVIQGRMVGALESIVPEEFITNMTAAVEQIGNLGGELKPVLTNLNLLLEPRTTEEVDRSAEQMVANISTLVQRMDASFKHVNTVLGDEAVQMDLKTTIATLRQTAESLKQLVNNTDQRIEKLTIRADETMVNLNDQVTQVARKLADTLDNMSGVLSELDTMASAVNQGQGLLGKIIHDPKMYEELLTSIDELEQLLIELRKLAASIQTDGLKTKLR